MGNASTATAQLVGNLVHDAGVGLADIGRWFEVAEMAEQRLVIRRVSLIAERRAAGARNDGISLAARELWGIGNLRGRRARILQAAPRSGCERTRGTRQGCVGRMISLLALRCALLRRLNSGNSVLCRHTDAATALLVLVIWNWARIRLAGEGARRQHLSQAVKPIHTRRVAGLAHGPADLPGLDGLARYATAAVAQADLHFGDDARVRSALKGCWCKRGRVARQGGRRRGVADKALCGAGGR
mmetsp:Transcript_16108/g.38260  ORF Transcript_16108/g.38260 Transcript_16108/m.38260 type:complete len:243 (-) Transcript_16108:129-857(-)